MILYSFCILSRQGIVVPRLCGMCVTGRRPIKGKTDMKYLILNNAEPQKRALKEKLSQKNFLYLFASTLKLVLKALF